MHGWKNPETCYKCHPDLRPTCEPCKAKNVKLFRHHFGSRNCSSKDLEHEESPRSANFCVDSGSTDHIVNNKVGYSAYRENFPSEQVRTANGSLMKAWGYGTISYSTKTDPKQLLNVLFIPQSECNLLSVPRLTQDGHTVVFDRKGCYVLDDMNNEIMRGIRKGSLYTIELPLAVSKHGLSSIKQNNKSSSIQVWLRKYAHCNTQSIRKLLTHNMVNGLYISKD